MQDYRINVNYARALMQLAAGSEEEQRVYEDMCLVHKVCMENRELNAVFDNPEIRPAKKCRIVEALFGEHVSKTSMMFMLFVVRKKRSVNLKGISSMFAELYRERHGMVLSHLVTATPASEETQTMARRLVEELTHKEVLLDTREDKRVIGGLSVEFDNKMYDATTATKLAKLRRKFEENVFESKL